MGKKGTNAFLTDQDGDESKGRKNEEPLQIMLHVLNDFLFL